MLYLRSDCGVHHVMAIILVGPVRITTKLGDRSALARHPHNEVRFEVRETTEQIHRDQEGSDAAANGVVSYLRVASPNPSFDTLPECGRRNL
jgi:hypothetical protein